MFSVTLSQCAEGMKAKLESNRTYETIAKNSDVIGLLKLLKNIAYNFEFQRYPLMEIQSSLKAYYTRYQKYHTP